MLLAAAVKACALLTAADIIAVMGEAPRKVPAPTPLAAASRCTYTLAKSAASVSVEVTRGEQARQLLDRLREAARVEGDESGGVDEPAIEPINGLGEEAFFALGSGNGRLYLWRRKTLFCLFIENSDTARTRLDKLRQLARRALSHLRR